MKLRLKLNARMMIFLLSASVIIYAISIGLISIKLQKQALKNTISLTNTYANQYSQKTMANLNRYMVVTRTLEQAFINFENIPESLRRKTFSEILIRVLQENPDFISVWTIWEPNSIDQLDEQFINKPGCTFKGNFSPTYFRDKEQIKLMANTATVLFQGDYYTIPKATKTETLLDPYFYSYTGNQADEILETNMIVPIIKNNRFLGVVGIDVPLSSLTDMVDGIKPLAEGYAFICANNGVIIAHPNPLLTGASFAEIFAKTNLTDEILTKIKEGAKFSQYLVDPTTKRKSYVSFAPIYVGKAPLPWSMAIVVPMSKMEEKANRSFYFSVFIGFAGLLLLTFIIIVISRYIIRPIILTTKLLQDIAKGEIDLSKAINIKTNDEIGEMAESVNKLIANLNKTALFASHIGNGQLDVEYNVSSENDILGTSLLKMRENLIKAQKEELITKAEDEKRNWSTQGLARFGEILREHSSNLDELSESIARNLSEYMNAAQCAFFIVNDDNPFELVYELKSIYAYKKRKLYEKKIAFGEDLIGRSAQEKITLYLPQVPEDYVSITQGLSTEQNPRTVLIVPLNLNDFIYGVIEIITYHKLEPYQIDFVEKIGESIASTIASVKVNMKTEKLLDQSKHLEDELAQQEEEMRQNLEEMQATQDETAKREAELRGILSIINSSALVAELDPDGCILTINEKLALIFGSTPDLMTRKHFSEFISKKEEEQLKFSKVLENLRDGNSQRVFRQIFTGNKEIWLDEHYSPVFEMDEVKNIILIAIDVTEEKLLEKQIRALEIEIADIESKA